MSMDFVKALKAPLSVDGWFVKLLIGGVFLIIPILNFVIMGYVVKYLEKLMNKEEGLPGSPASDFGDKFVLGFKYLIGCIVLGVIYVIGLTIFALLFSKLKLVYAVLMVLLQITLGLLTLLMAANFAIDKKILSFIGFPRAFMLVKDNPNTLNFILQVVGLSVIYVLLMALLAVLVIPLPFLAYAFTLSLYNLLGQYVQDAPHLAEARADI